MGEYLTIAAVAQRDRWVAELTAAGLSAEQIDEVIASQSFGPLAAELRRAESSGIDIAAALPKVVAQRGLDDAEDIGAVLISRRPPRDLGTESRRSASAEAHRRTRPGRRRTDVDPRCAGRWWNARTCWSRGQPRWPRQPSHGCGRGSAGSVCRPLDPRQRDLWMQEVRVVAAYRDLYGVDSDSPVGPAGDSDRQRVDEARARKAVRRAADIAEEARDRAPGGLAPKGRVLG